jgi:hypothetical protein
LTATQSSEKSRDVLLAMFTMRTLKLAFARSDALHVRPHVFVAPPRT